MKNKLFILSILGLTIFTTSCGDDDNPGVGIEVPDTYLFTRDGESTVSFSGQTTRILMAEEIVSSLKNNSLNEATIDAMFTHAEGDADFSNPDLNASDKNVRSKVAASSDYFSANTALASTIKADFDGWIEAQVSDVFPFWNNDATAGNAGQIQEAGGGSVRYVNGKGLEYDQAFGKGLIGALMVDQILNNYVSTSVLDAGNNREDNDAGLTLEGKSYTNMEHKWDEAYGYVYGTAANPADPNATIGQDDNFLNKYIGRMENDPDFEGIAEDIFNAFKLGRAAIVAGEYDIRDEQAEIIREKISMIIGIRAVYYLQQAKAGLEAVSIDYGAVFHDISEGYGFIYSLQFTRNPSTDQPYFNNAEVEALLADLMDDGVNGLWDVNASTLEAISDEIANRFTFTKDQAGS